MNQFYVDPAISRSVGSLLGGVGQDIRASREREQRQLANQARLEEATQVLRSGDPVAVSEYMLKNPDMQAAMEKSQQYVNDATKQKRIESLIDIYSGKPAAEVAGAASEFIRSQGGTSEATEAFGQLPQEEAQRKAGIMLATMLPPDQFKNIIATSDQGKDFTLSEGQARYDAGGNLVAERPKPVNTLENDMKQSKDYFDKAKQLRGEVDKISSPYRKVEESYDRIKATISGDSTGASDMALVFSFMKMLDPGSSVMEGEYSNASNTGGVSAKVRNTYNKIIDGQILTPRQRKNFIKQAESQYKASTGRYKNRMKAYERLGDRQGIERDDFIVLGAEDTVPTSEKSNAPQAAIDYLRQNPQFTEQFRRKYGYVPEDK